MIPTIIETSETESFSEKCYIPEETTSLDDLFADLKKETCSAPAVEDYRSIEKSIQNLPKINASLESKLDKKPIRIHDPVGAKPAQTSDNGWFNMKQPEMTPEIKRDLQIIKQRSALDPKRHYKKDKWQIPKFFQMGTIIEGNTEFYSSRLKRKERGKTMVEELLHDDNTKKYFKRKYHEIQQSKTSGRKGFYKKVKNARKKY
ncbi:rRNA-processing protein, putative [Candida dubliniensis CD36]|uniref:rRNA-processing protein, putative n=1 Tax=Candida dubliniensis (strain CD36 / ATCC MYA-646 / CBS 7987 / NCPF 3949 / NRRL Y-17841) TaxID=573826 RepID=B9WF00_CANDC|nr:rRNA-processing protein, putative [Candida dubliniensis CD36]CAX43264.1 rRNA-processing protein, putative [Candida dubliniensis CD36]